MKRVYVQPSQRGNGIARALSLRVIREARERGYAQVAISTWNNATPAITLYESLGFKPIPPFKQSPFPNLVFMGLDMAHHDHESRVTSHVQVIKVSGSDLDDPVFSQRFASSVAAVVRSGAAPVIVHGGGKELTELLAAMQVETRFVDGLRVTDARTRDAALMVLSGLANKRLVAALQMQGVDAIGVSGLDAGLIRVERLSLELEFVGKPISVRTELLTNWAGQGIVPVLSPMSIGADGEIYNVNADHVAGAIAAAMNADMLTFVTNVRGVLDNHKSLVTSLTKTQAEALIADGTIGGGMIPKVRTALEALEAGVATVRITDLDGIVENSGTLFVK
jgi:acetylglutamate kinase